MKRTRKGKRTLRIYTLFTLFWYAHCTQYIMLYRASDEFSSVVRAKQREDWERKRVKDDSIYTVTVYQRTKTSCRVVYVFSRLLSHFSSFRFPFFRCWYVMLRMYSSSFSLSIPSLAQHFPTKKTQGPCQCQLQKQNWLFSDC